ncbi:MAG: SRPBCC family protein [Gammaproteobacteria bacterium]
MTPTRPALSRDRARRPPGAACALLFAGTFAWADAARAGTVEHAEITHSGNRYEVDAEVTVDAPLAAVEAIVSDYERLARLSPLIKRSRVITRLDEFRTKRVLDMRPCVLMFCFDFVMTEIVDNRGDGNIVTTIVPEESDFSAGLTRWQVSEDTPGRTRVRVHAFREPRFWVPPIVGPWILKQRMRAEIVHTMERLEAIARDDAAAVPAPAP